MFLYLLKQNAEVVPEMFLGKMDTIRGTRMPNIVNQLALATLLLMILFFVVWAIRAVMIKVNNYIVATPWIVPYMKEADKELRIVQDPNDPTAVPLRRSLNERNGIEFTYMTWLYVKNFTYKQGELKHIFHKGNFDGKNGLRAPAMYFAPVGNKLIVIMNTFESPDEQMEIEDIPSAKWFHVSLVLKERELFVYINGLLRNRKLLSSLPRQNFGDLFLSLDGGFSGFLSRFRYFDYATSFSEIESEVSRGPSTTVPSDSMQKPPYLQAAWWI